MFTVNADTVGLFPMMLKQTFILLCKFFTPGEVLNFQLFFFKHIVAVSFKFKICCNYIIIMIYHQMSTRDLWELSGKN